MCYVPPTPLTEAEAMALIAALVGAVAFIILACCAYQWYLRKVAAFNQAVEDKLSGAVEGACGMDDEPAAPQQQQMQQPMGMQQPPMMMQPGMMQPPMMQPPMMGGMGMPMGGGMQQSSSTTTTTSTQQMGY